MQLFYTVHTSINFVWERRMRDQIFKIRPDSAEREKNKCCKYVRTRALNTSTAVRLLAELSTIQ